MSHLIAACKQRGLPLVSSMGTAGRCDLLRSGLAIWPTPGFVRWRRKSARFCAPSLLFPKKGSLAFPSVFSVEKPRDPIELHYDDGMGFACVSVGRKKEHHSCEERRVIYGTTSYVTGSFGLFLRQCCRMTADGTARQQTRKRLMPHRVGAHAAAARRLFFVGGRSSAFHQAFCPFGKSVRGVQGSSSRKHVSSRRIAIRFTVSHDPDAALSSWSETLEHGTSFIVRTGHGQVLWGSELITLTKILYRSAAERSCKDGVHPVS